jgi:hypothetical protein
LLRYAAGFLEAGFRDQAISACRKAIQIDAESAAGAVLKNRSSLEILV